MAFRFWVVIKRKWRPVLEIIRCNRIPALIVLCGLMSILAVGTTGFAGANHAGYEPKPPARVTDNNTGKNTLTADEVRLVARVVEGEAANEPYQGKMAVAAVVLNRVEHNDFPDSVHDVVFQPRAFCVVANGLVNRTPSSESFRAVHAAVAGKDPTGGALYFWNPNKRVNSWMWTRTPTATIGDHAFGR
ncbi:MAG: cell wall hydrolase [Candidatus Desulforudis sp.]|nr:cell wall hydrolase [Desulforudis sp.]